jgi:hypothetical protein
LSRRGAGDAWFRLLADKKQAVTPELDHVFEPSAAAGQQRTPQDWLAEGRQLVENLSENDPVGVLARARGCFEQCGASALAMRVDAETARRQAGSRPDDRELKIKAARLCVASGMWAEAGDLVAACGLRGFLQTCVNNRLCDLQSSTAPGDAGEQGGATARAGERAGTPSADAASPV